MKAHEDCERVQDPYSMRCVPQVHGASRNAFEHLRSMAETELNS
jgi:histidine ammonia-lyase